jgi:hypothetical protein
LWTQPIRQGRNGWRYATTEEFASGKPRKLHAAYVDETIPEHLLIAEFSRPLHPSTPKKSVGMFYASGPNSSCDQTNSKRSMKDQALIIAVQQKAQKEAQKKFQQNGQQHAPQQAPQRSQQKAQTATQPTPKAQTGAQPPGAQPRPQQTIGPASRPPQVYSFAAVGAGMSESAGVNALPSFDPNTVHVVTLYESGKCGARLNTEQFPPLCRGDNGWRLATVEELSRSSFGVWNVKEHIPEHLLVARFSEPLRGPIVLGANAFGLPSPDGTLPPSRPLPQAAVDASGIHPKAPSGVPPKAASDSPPKTASGKPASGKTPPANGGAKAPVGAASAPAEAKVKRPPARMSKEELQSFGSSCGEGGVIIMGAGTTTSYTGPDGVKVTKRFEEDTVIGGDDD